ncbi:hypothetical protein M422DRAFT_249911 [Sphaerobolus stellatus SS14]|uniref:Uncharacterized protein n=1 Tax=Sphaerobolus stellatus (strain SS14) TaxID=990650 RepID=A0A0C9W3S0_SPHS4|nr:hypothetical protein M422DRAFT_249911 [Sphaerobolus stellatus SS14]
MDDLKERIQELEAQLSSLQLSTTISEHSLTHTTPTSYQTPVGSNHPLSSPAKVTYSQKHARKLDENEDFRNCILKPDVRPDHWSLHMCKPFGFDSNSLNPEYQQTCWITDLSTCIWLGSQITKGTKSKAQSTESVRLPQGSEFLALILKHCSLSREQVYERIIPYMERDEEKWPICRFIKAPLPPIRATQTGESSQQCLDADLDSYNQVHDPVLPYDEAPPSGIPYMEMEVPAVVGTSGTLHNESTMNVDLELEDLYA